MQSTDYLLTLYQPLNEPTDSNINKIMARYIRSARGYLLTFIGYLLCARHVPDLCVSYETARLPQVKAALCNGHLQV